jgi:Na+/melibiose symporter-like transporter
MQIVLSPDVNKRARLVAVMQGVGGLAGIFSSIAVIPMLNAFGGQTNPAAWTMVSIVLTIVFIILFYFSTFWVKEYDAYEPPVQNQGIASVIKIGDQLKAVIKNVPLIIIIIGFATDSFAMQIGQALNMYFFRYNLDGRTDLIPILGTVGLPIAFGVMLVIPFVSRWIGKKWGIMVSEAGAILFTLLLLYAVPMHNIPLVMVSMIGISFMFNFTNTLSRAAVLDCANYAEWKFGVKVNGLISSTFTFINKVAQAVSALIMGVNSG